MITGSRKSSVRKVGTCVAASLAHLLRRLASALGAEKRPAFTELGPRVSIFVLDCAAAI